MQTKEEVAMMVNYYASLYKAQKPQLLKKIKKSATTSY
jgi:hypothetical protein